MVGSFIFSGEMQFRIFTSSQTIHKNASKRYINGLKKLGFEIEELDINDRYDRLDMRLGLKRKIKNHSEYDGPMIEVNTLEDLIKLQDKVGSIILSGDTIEIYNGSRE